MNNNGGNYVYALGLDTAAFAQSVDKAKRMFQGLGDTATAAGEEADEAFNKMKNSIASVAAGVSLGMLVKKIAEVRGEVQQLEVAFETMLGSKQKADALMAQMVELAAKTPFGLQDVTNGAKQLLAFGSASEEVAAEITMLGDIAAGLSIPLGDLIYLYGTTRTQGGLFTQDLRQFMSRGIPLADELAKVMGKSTNEVRELVSAGKVGFPEVQKALQSMTSEGGQFGGLMEKQSQTITGQISALQDAIYQMFNEIGESSEGVISDVLSGASWIVEHYEAILKILSKVVIAWGAYKAALIAVAAVQKIKDAALLAKTLVNVAKGATTAAAAFRGLNTAMKSNPWGLIASIAATVIAFIWDWVAGVKEATEATEDMKREIGELEQAVQDELVEVNKLVIKLKQVNIEEGERASILKRLEEINPNLVSGLRDEAVMISTLTANLADYNEEQRKRLMLASLADKQESAVKDYVEAQADYDLYVKAVEDKMTELLAAYTSTGKLPTVSVPSGFPIDAEEIQGRIKKFYDQAINGEITLIELSHKLYEDVQLGHGVYGVTDDWREKIDIYGVNEEYIEKTLAAKEEALKNAKTKMENANKDVSYLEELYGFSTSDIEKKYGGKGGEVGASVEETDNEKLAAARIKLAGDTRRAMTEAEINAMEEGLTKKLAMIDYEYDEEERKINEREAELRTLAGGSLSVSDATNIAAMRAANAKNKETKTTQALQAELVKRNMAWEDYLIQFGTFQERFKATQDKYSRLIAEAETEGERKTLEAERDAALAAFEVQASAWAKDLANKSIAELNKMMQELEEQVDAKQKAFDALESSDGAEAKDYLKTINELKAKIAELKKQLSGASKEAKGGNWEGAAQVVQGIANAASEAASALEGVDDELANTINGMAKFANVAASLVSAIAAVAAASTTLNMALGIIGLIATAIQVVSTVIGGIVQANKEYEQTIENFKALNKELEQMRELSRIDSVEGTIFGSDAFGNFSNNLNVMRDAAKAYEESMDAVANRAKTIGEILGTELAKYIGQDINKLVGERHSSLYESLSQMLVELSKYKASTLGEQLPELFAGGEVTLEGLQKLKDSDIWEKLSKENRDLIDQMIKDWEVFNESTEAVTAYLTDIFGEMGNSINDAIVEAFMNGSDAALEFGDIAGQVIENLIKQVGHSAYIAPILTKAMADVEALNGQGLSSEEYLNALMGIVGDAMKVAGENVEAYNEFLENADQYAESVGINTFDSERSAESKGIAQASQDSVDELNGRITAIQGHTYSLVEGQRQLINDTAQVLRHLAGIESNTAELRQMRMDMAAMRSDISDIATRGIITR